MNATILERAVGSGTSGARLRRSEELWAWAFAGPAVLLGSVFIILPFLMAIVISFTNQRLIAAPSLPTRFIGLQNYQLLLTDPDFWQALRNTAFFVLVVVPVQTSFALLLAMLINRRGPGINFFRGTFFVPVVLPMVVVATVWSFLYAYDQTGANEGLVNNFIQLVSFGQLGPYWWVGDPNVAMLAI